MDALKNLLLERKFTDLCLNGDGSHFIDFGGGLIPLDQALADSFRPEYLKTWILQSLAQSGKAWDAKFPFIDFSLATGHRVHVSFPPISKGITISIRRIPTPSEHQLWGKSSEYEILKDVIKKKQTLIISGGTGAGKTTLLNQLISEIPDTERLIALEDTEELAPKHPHFLKLISRTANADGFGEVTLRMLLKQTLRMRPDRVILGECRGDEILELLQALNTGHTGTLATLHANSAREALQRIELMCLLSAQGSIPLSALRQLLSTGIQYIAQLKKVDGIRQITEIWKVEGREGDTILLRPVIQLGQNGPTHSRIS